MLLAVLLLGFLISETAEQKAIADLVEDGVTQVKRLLLCSSLSATHNRLHCFNSQCSVVSHMYVHDGK